MTTDINITVFKEFARLEDPYECARYAAKLDSWEPFKKQVYVGRIDQLKAGTPVAAKPSTDICLREATAPYELLKTETISAGPDRESLNAQTERHLSQSYVRVRSVLDNRGKWDAYMFQYNREKALKSDAAEARIPRCLSWSVEEASRWLLDIGMGKYEVSCACLTAYSCRQKSMRF